MVVTPADIQRVARQYLDPAKQVVVWSLPKAAGRAAGKAHHKPAARARGAARQRVPASAAKEFTLRNATRVELPNGLVLMLYENHRLPLVVASAQVRRTRLHEPEDRAGVAELTGTLLDTGTATHTGREIAERIEDVGGILEMSSSGGTVKVLSPDRRRGLEILLECLMNPTFPKEAFEREKERQLATIESGEQEPDTRAQQTYRELVYGKHPFGRNSLGTTATVKRLRARDCAEFHRQVYLPNNTTLALVGDFDTRQVIDEVKKLTAGWKKGVMAKPQTPEPQKPPAEKQQIVTLPDAAQLHFYMGHPGIRRSNPDYYRLLVMDHVLGNRTRLHRPAVGAAARSRGSGLHRGGDDHQFGG
jgi:zinc protease